MDLSQLAFADRTRTPALAEPAFAVEEEEESLDINRADVAWGVAMPVLAVPARILPALKDLMIAEPEDADVAMPADAVQPLPSPKSRAVGGYTAPFVGPLDKELECPICLCALRDPVQTGCGHLYCTGCFEQAAK